MNSARDRHALVVCNKCLYAVGGKNNDFNFNSVEKLKNLEGRWENALPMNIPRSDLAVVGLENAVYAIGGKSGSGAVDTEKSVEKLVIEKNKWSYVSDMNTARWGHAA